MDDRTQGDTFIWPWAAVACLCDLWFVFFLSYVYGNFRYYNVLYFHGGILVKQCGNADDGYSAETDLGLSRDGQASDPGRLSKNKVRNIRRQINNIKNITNSWITNLYLQHILQMGWDVHILIFFMEIVRIRLISLFKTCARDPHRLCH